MKRHRGHVRTRSFLAGLVAALAFASPLAFAQETRESTDATSAKTVAPAGFPFVGVIEGDRVNLRSGFSENYRSLKNLERGEKVVVLNEQAGWYQVRVPSTFAGWVNRQFLKADGEDAVIVTGDRVSFRPGPDTRHLPVGYVNSGQRLSVVGEQGDWIQVVAPAEMPAWVNRELVRPLGPVDGFAAELQAATAAGMEIWKAKRGDVQKQRADNEHQLALSKKFDDAEAKLKEQSDQGTPDFDALVPVYEEVSKDAHDPLLAQGARFRLDQLKNHADFEKKIRESQDIISQLELDLKQNEQKYLESLEKLRKGVEVRPADGREVGWVTAVYTLDFKRGFPAFALSKGGSNLYFLDSRKYELKDFVGKHVVIQGDIQEQKGLDLSVLAVRNIEILADGL